MSGNSNQTRWIRRGRGIETQKSSANYVTLQRKTFPGLYRRLYTAAQNMSGWKTTKHAAIEHAWMHATRKRLCQFGRSKFRLSTCRHMKDPLGIRSINQQLGVDAIKSASSCVN
jgi:hypothetical protein